ncbi:hypothetical protein H5410_045884 [Solanum commersonii]|uniref:Uncharacterized protein n=1 Tax=Solanum commersonii TaxID=4109 RepID=A0A9J5XCJ5_SOLCO|nr:hypothetical protein H5410_045884 [Solanum commersonii]
MLYMSNVTCIIHISVIKVMRVGELKLKMRMNTIIHGGSFSEFNVLWDLKGNVEATLGLLFFHNWNSTNVNSLSKLIDGTLLLLIYGSVVLMEHLKKILVLVHSGNLVVAKGFRIHDTINIVAEARAIRENLNYCNEHEISNRESGKCHGVWHLEISITRRLRRDILQQ